MNKKFRMSTTKEILKEDLEALSSPNYLKRIALARKSKKFISSAEAKKRLGIN